MTYEQAMLSILQSPDEDGPRRALASLVRASEPEWANLIELQLELAQLRRRERYRTSSTLKVRALEALGHVRDRVTRDIGFYMGEIPKHREVEFDRGLVRLCTLNPYMFLEQGEYILSKIAPLRGVWFYDDPEGAPFPMKELAASPLLAHLDEIRFHDCEISDEHVEVFAASPYLDRLLVLDMRTAFTLSFRAIEALAASPATRKCLVLRNYVGAKDNGPIGEHQARDTTDLRHYDFEMSAEGVELERKYGYIPWLHFANNPWNPADAHYWVEQRVLPIYQPGSPVGALVQVGQGVRPPARPLLPRSEAAPFLTPTVQ